MKRFSILVREHEANKETELRQTDSNPQAIVEGAKAKTLSVYRSPEASRRSTVPKYESTRIIRPRNMTRVLPVIQTSVSRAIGHAFMRLLGEYRVQAILAEPFAAVGSFGKALDLLSIDGDELRGKSE